MLINRYRKDSEIQAIALEVSEAASCGRNDAVSSMIRTFFAPVQEVAAELADHHGVLGASIGIQNLDVTALVFAIPSTMQYLDGLAWKGGGNCKQVHAPD